ncbi:VOC family protein [Amycolatopsis sp. H20-H5]|uniref:VOC family protein n=1 Tax=Amycolatopsis sp. H20-H5 TaxID=3046309 RepID=UPI002DB6A113|nr:VOC family protein [Amycolatopsis sp. H20-H5]MEC3977610.1 VOC family protein [Amycolatopsis sp. H20-H5]
MSVRGRPRHPDQLTPAEWRVVDGVRHGMSNRVIAERRGISRDAVKFHVANALRKLGLSSRAELRTWRGVPVDSALARAGPSEGGGPMLGALGQVSRTVSDLGRAVAFYGGVLGLDHLYTFGDLAFFDCDGTRLFLSAVEEVGVESVLYFRVADITAAYEGLSAKGVVFAGAPHRIFRHESGVEEWMAFFEDPDGHTTALMARLG